MTKSNTQENEKLISVNQQMADGEILIKKLKQKSTRREFLFYISTDLKRT
jgi:hypothetical protein